MGKHLLKASFVMLSRIINEGRFTLQHISLFLKINFFITTLLYLSFLIFNQEQAILTSFFSIAAAISTSATLYLIFYLAFALFFSFERIMKFFLPLFFFFVNFALIIDFIIFKVWKFHINAMVMNIITSPSAWDSLHVGTDSILIVGAIILFLLVGKYLLFHRLKKLSIQKAKHLNKTFNYRILPLILIMIIGEKVSFGMADVYNKRELLESVKPIPLYQPLTFIRFVEKYFGIQGVEKVVSKHTIDKNSKVNYPLHPITIQPDSKSPNIFIFMFDAARNSILSPQVTPHVTALKKDSLVFNNHISGGDATRFGIFSFFYGLNATYWFNFLDAQKEPVLFDVLKQKEYQIKIISSTDTQWPEFKQTVYCGVTKSISDGFEGVPYEKDAQSTEVFKKWIADADKKKPLFSFVFLDAPHGYSYPKEFEKFKPNIGGDGVNYIGTKVENRQELLNSYKNAVYYNDKLFGQMIASLKEKGLYDDAIILFSSDHGEEFYEYGFFGHNSSFSKAQVNSPLVFKLPSKEHKEIEKMTSHLDMPATLLKLLGVKNPASDYSCGEDVLDQNFKRTYSYVAKWSKNAIITDHYTYIYSNLPNEIFKSEIRDTPKYQKVLHSPDEQIESVLLKVLEQNRRFIK